MPFSHRQWAIAAALATSLVLPAGAQTPPPAAAAAPTATAPQGAAKQERMQKRHTERLAKLKTELKITAEQEGAWQAFTQAMQPPQKAQRMQREEMRNLTTPERIDRMRSLRQERNAQMDQRADAIKAFYAALTPEQQKQFDAKGSRMGPRGEGHPGRWGARHGHHGGGSGN